MTSGTIFCTCWISCVFFTFSRSLFSLSLRQKAECHVKEKSRKYFQGKFTDMAKPRPMNLVSHSMQERNLHRTWVIPETRRMPKRDKAVFYLLPGHRCEAQRHTRADQRWSFEMCKSQTTNTCEQFSKTCNNNWNYERFTKILDWRIQGQCIDVGIVHVINDENSHLGPNFTGKSGPKQKYLFIQILFRAWEKIQILQKQIEDEEDKWQNFD